MKCVSRISGTPGVWNSGTVRLVRFIVAAIAVALPYLRQVRAADQPGMLSVRDQEIIRLVTSQHSSTVYNLAFSPRSNSLVCVFALERNVQVWDVSAKPRLIAILKPPLPKDFSWKFERLYSHPIAFSKDGSRLGTSYVYGSIQVWDFDQRSILLTLKPRVWMPEAIQFSSTDHSLVIGCCSRGAYSIQGQFPSKIELVRQAEYEQLPAQHSKKLQTNENMRLPGQTTTCPQAHEDSYCIGISEDGERMFSGGGPVFRWIPRDYSRESLVTVWESRTGNRLFAVGSKELPILAFCLSPDGRVLYSCGNKVVGWSATKPGPPIRRFDVPIRRTISVAVSRDGTLLAAGASDGAVVIWDTDSTTRLGTCTHSGGPVYGLAFSPTSTKLVAAGEQGIATVWDLKWIPRK